MKALYFVFTFIFVLAITASITLWRFSLVEPPKLEKVASQNIDSNYIPAQGNHWFDRVANFSQSVDVLPTNLMYIAINNGDNNTIPSPKAKFELLISKCDFYSIFCINRLASALGVGLTLIKRGDENKIILSVENKNIALNLVSDLQKYNIHSKIKEVEQ